MGARGKPASPVQLGVVIGAVFFVMYLLTATRDLVGDETFFARSVDGFFTGKLLPREFFHPHHPLFNPLIAAVTWVIRLLGFRPIILDIGAGFAAFFAAAVVAALVPVLRRAGVREGAALLAAAVAGASGGFWRFATCMEVYTLTAAAVLLWLATVGRDRPAPLTSGASLAASMLSHLAAGLLAVPTVIRFRKRPHAMAVALGLGLTVATTTVILVFVLGLHAYTPAQWLSLLLPDYTAGYLGKTTEGTLLRTVADLAVWDWYRRVPIFSPATSHVLDVASVVVLAILLVALVAGILVAVRGRNPLAVTAALGLAVYVPLWLFWDVGNVEHAVAVTPLFATLIAFGAASLPRRSGEVALAAAVGVLLVVNGLASAVPQSRPENGRDWVIAAFVSENVPNDAVVLSVGVDPRLRLSLPYLSGRRVVTLRLDVESAKSQGRSPIDGLAYWMHAGIAGRSVWATPEVLDPQSASAVQRMGIPVELWLRVMQAVRPVERRVLEPDGLIIREPFVLTRITLAN